MKVANASVGDMQNLIKSTEEKYRSEVKAIDKSIAKYRNIQSVMGVVETVSIILAIIGFVMILGVVGSSDFESFYGVEVMSHKEALIKGVVGAIFVGMIYPISVVTDKVCNHCDSNVENLKKSRKECYGQLSYVKGAIGLLMRKMG